MMSDYFAANDHMKADGVLCEGEGLKGIGAPTPLRIKFGKVETTDGPFVPQTM